MKKIVMLIALVTFGWMTVSADNDSLTIALDLNAETQVADLSAPEITFEIEAPSAISEDGKDGLKYYRNWLGEKCIDFGDQPVYYDFKRDMTFVGVPVFALGWALNSEKKAFRSLRKGFIGGFHTEIDNYTQFAPYALILGLKASGYQGRSSWDRLMVSTLASNVIMAGIVNGIKYGAKEERPDGSTKNSFPSGHTATAFVAATVLHKEYGMTRSPWFSVGGYAVATATGFMRVMNNRHWISDVIAGAGIGILSTEVGYWIGDMIYKNKGITHLELEGVGDSPSFFDIHMGIGLHSNKLVFDEYADGYTGKIPLGEYSNTLELGTSTSVGIEGAYFLNKYIGVGGMARVTTTPVKGLDMTDTDFEYIDASNAMVKEFNQDYALNLPYLNTVTVDNENLLDISFDAGVYGNLPITDRFSLGAKVLIGARLSKGFTYEATMRDANGQILMEPMKDGEDPQARTFKFIDVDGNNSFNYVLGISATYKYKQNFAWKVFVDYDSSKNKYNLYNRFRPDDILLANALPPSLINYSYYASKHLAFWTIGAAFTITF